MYGLGNGAPTVTTGGGNSGGTLTPLVPASGSTNAASQAITAAKTTQPTIARSITIVESLPPGVNTNATQTTQSTGGTSTPTQAAQGSDFMVGSFNVSQFIKDNPMALYIGIAAILGFLLIPSPSAGGRRR